MARNATPSPTTDDQVDRSSAFESPDRVVRLNVNLSAATADALRTTSAQSGLSMTEGVRRSVSIWKFLDDAVRAGERVEIVDPKTGRTRELVLGL